MKWPLILLLLFVSVCHHQVIYAQNFPQPNTTHYDPRLDQYVGEWIWEGENEVFKWTVSKVMITHVANIKAEALRGYHHYEKDGKVIDSSYDKYLAKVDTGKTVIISSKRRVENDGKLWGSIREMAKNKSAELIIQYNFERDELMVEVTNEEGIRIGPFDPTHSIPTSFIMKRVRR